MIAVLGALRAEVKECLGAVENGEEHSWKDHSFVTGNLEGHQVVVAPTGIGKVLSALATQKVIDLFSPSHIVFIGIAGAVDTGLNVGDILIARDCVQWDMDLTRFGVKRGKIPFTPHRFIPCDPGLVERASTFALEEGSVHVGRIVTGDRFVNDAASPEYTFLNRELAGHAVEMEGAAVALTAGINGVPCLVARIISDRADSTHPLKLKRFLKKASRTSLELVRHILSQL